MQSRHGGTELLRKLKSQSKRGVRHSLVLGRWDAGGEAAHGIEGIFLDALQPVGPFGVRAIKFDAVADQLGHGDAFA